MNLRRTARPSSSIVYEGIIMLHVSTVLFILFVTKMKLFTKLKQQKKKNSAAEL